MLSRRRFLLTAAASAPALALHSQEATPAPAATAPAQTPPPEPTAAPTAAPTAPPAADTLPAPILALKNRTKDVVPITTDERQTRLDLARELMGDYKIDAILITTGASLKYFTGASWWQSERLFAYVLPKSAAPFIVCPYFERERLNDLLLKFPERETTIIYLWQEDEDPYKILQRALAEYSLATGNLGIEEHTQFAFANSIGRACPALKIVSATPVTAGCRSLKSPAEIALLRLANSITFDVYKAVYESCGPGDTNHKFTDLVAKAYARCGVHGDASCNVGIDSALPHGRPGPQVIREGDMVLIDDGCTVEGYTSDISRAFVYGAPTDFQREIFRIVQNAQSAALAAARPGVEMQAVDAAARAVITEAGYGPAFDHFTHRLGHGIGIDMHEWPYLVGGNTQKLVANMLFSNEPGIYLRGKFGIRLEDDMLITENGAELLTTQSPSLQDPFSIPAIVAPKSDSAPSDTPNDDPNAPKPIHLKPPDTAPSTPPK